MLVGLNVGDELRGVHVADAEEHRRRHKASLPVAKNRRNSRPERIVPISRRVNHNLRHRSAIATLAEKPRTAGLSVPDNWLHKCRVQEDLHPRLGAHLVEKHLEFLGVEGRHMVVSLRYPRGVRSVTEDALRMQRTATRDEALDDLLEEPSDDHLLARLVVAGHERPDKPLRRHSAEHAALLDDQNLRTVPRGGNRCADAGGTSTDDEDIRLVVCRTIRPRT